MSASLTLEKKHLSPIFGLCYLLFQAGLTSCGRIPSWWWNGHEVCISWLWTSLGRAQCHTGSTTVATLGTLAKQGGCEGYSLSKFVVHGGGGQWDIYIFDYLPWTCFVWIFLHLPLWISYELLYRTLGNKSTHSWQCCWSGQPPPAPWGWDPTSSWPPPGPVILTRD